MNTAQRDRPAFRSETLRLCNERSGALYAPTVLDNVAPFGASSGVCTNRHDAITRFINDLRVGTVDVWEVPGYRIELTPFGGIKDSGLRCKEGVQEAMKSFTNLKTCSLPWE
jgi:acyl-CoA reductase-like NAD-dependent aldehyde dehydrogenase